MKIESENALYWMRNLSQYQFIYIESHSGYAEIEGGPPRCESG